MCRSHWFLLPSILTTNHLLLSHVSRVRPSATPWTAAFQAPPFMGFSRQEYWSQVPLPSPTSPVNPNLARSISFPSSQLTPAPFLTRTPATPPNWFPCFSSFYLNSFSTEKPECWTRSHSSAVYNLQVSPITPRMKSMLLFTEAESSASLCTSDESNLGERVLGEVEKDSFIALPDKGGHSRLIPSKPCVPTWGKEWEVLCQLSKEAWTLWTFCWCVVVS